MVHAGKRFDMKTRFICNAALWRDKVNGNTYHSCLITRVRDGKTISVPMQYGYGDHYRQSALEAMGKAKWLPVNYRGGLAYLYERENNYPIVWNVSEATKKECIRNGQE
jgi:hypothetical protein